MHSILESSSSDFELRWVKGNEASKLRASIEFKKYVYKNKYKFTKLCRFLQKDFRANGDNIFECNEGDTFTIPMSSFTCVSTRNDFFDFFSKRYYAELGEYWNASFKEDFKKHPEWKVIDACIILHNVYGLPISYDESTKDWEWQKEVISWGSFKIDRIYNDEELDIKIYDCSVINQDKRLMESLDKNKFYEQTINVRRLVESIEDQAYRVAKRKHDDTGAVRKHSGDPYIVHPVGVAKIAKAYGGTEEETAAAYLHDTIEDTGATMDDIREKFGDKVADIVRDVTNDPYLVKKLGKEEYINLELLSLPDSSLYVKLCDMYYNILDYPSQEQKDRIVRNVSTLLNSERDIEDDRCLDLIGSILEAA